MVSRRRLISTGLVLALFLAITVVMLYPLSIVPSTHARETGDTLFVTWILAWVARTLFVDPLNLYHANIFHPFPYSLAFSEILVANVPLVAPVIWLTGNSLLAHNVVLLTTFFLSCIGAYLLVVHLTGSRVAGIVAGVIFSFAPYKFAHIGHLQLLTAQWMPFSMFFLHRAIAARRWRDFLGFSVCFTLQALSSFYYALYLAIAVAVFCVYSIIVDRARLHGDTVLKFVVASALAGLIILPFTLPYFTVQRVYGFNRTLAETKDLSASFQDYFVVPPENRIYGRLTAPLASRSTWPVEHYLFPGIVPVLLALVGLLRFRRASAVSNSGTIAGYLTSQEARVGINIDVRETRSQGYYLLLGAVAFLLSLGPTLRVFGKDTGFPLPYLLLYEFVPGFKALRVPSRFDILVMLSIAVLAGYGISGLTRIVQQRRPGLHPRTFLGVAVTGVILLEYATFPHPIVPVETGTQVPPVYRWLAEQPNDTIVVELPADSQTHNIRYIYFSTYHWRRIVNGYSGFVPGDFWEIVRVLRDFPSDESIQLLHALGTELVIVHGDLYPSNRWEALRRQLTERKDLVLVESFGNDHVYRVSPMQVGSAPVHVAASLPLKVPSNQTFVAPIRITNQSDRPRIFSPTEELAIQAQWSGSEVWDERKIVRSPMIVLSNDVREIPVELRSPTTPGRYRLDFQIEGPEGLAQSNGVVDVVETLPDSLERKGHHALIGPCVVPDRVRSGVEFRFRCVVRNDGQSIWLARQDDVRGWVGLGIRSWRSPDGTVVLDINGTPLAARGMLAWPVYPGQTVMLAVPSEAPTTPGTYTVQLDVVSELVTWFGDVEASTPQAVQIVVD